MRRRIIGLTTISAILAIAVFGLPLAAVVGKYMLNEERAHLARETTSLALQIADGFGQGDDVVIPGHDEITFTLFGQDAERLRGSGSAGGPVSAALDGDEIVAGDTDTTFVVAVPLQENYEVVGVLQGDAPKRSTYLRIAGALGLMTVLGGAAVGAVWLVARRSAARLTRPLEDLATAARNVGAGDFSAHAPRSDIPEIDSVGMALNGASTRIGDMVARERAFSADASHQLRTPLTALRLILETAVDSPGQDLHAAILAALAGADRLEDTIDDLIALARDTRRSAEPLDLAQLLEELRRYWTDPLRADQRALDIRVDTAAVATASTAAVRQVLAVLVDNAVRHGRGTVRIEVRDAGDALAIDVTDGGHGPRLTERDLFTRRSRRAAGHGIGLAFARRLAEAEGGRLLLTKQSPPTFSLVLPASITHDGSNNALASLHTP